MAPRPVPALPAAFILLAAAFGPAGAQVRFTDVTQSSGLAGVGAVNLSWADYDNDGDPDLLVGCSRLFRNGGPPDFVFADVDDPAAEDVGEFAVEGLAPDPLARADPHHLGADPDLVSGAAHAPFENVIDPEFPPDVLELGVLALEEERRRSSGHPEPRYPSQGREQEWQLYPECIQLFAEGRLKTVRLRHELAGGRVFERTVVKVLPSR